MDLLKLKKIINKSTKFTNKNGLVYSLDALEFLQSIPKNAANIIFLDPPFNLNKKYAKDSAYKDNMKEFDYITYINLILNESIRILKPGGSLFLYHVPKFAMIFGAKLQNENSLNFRHWIAVSMKNGFPVKNKLYPAHYALLYFTKGEPVFFNRPKILPSECRSCGELIKDYGGYKKFIENGINLSDFWEDISPVRHSKFKHRSSNQLPEKLMHRVFNIGAKKNYLIIDPFVGSGTTARVCIDHSLKFIVNDREEDAIEVTINRIKGFKNENS